MKKKNISNKQRLKKLESYPKEILESMEGTIDILDEYTKNIKSSSSSKSKVEVRFNYVYKKLSEYVERNKE